eukprot:2040472-Rhodomonas_salina.1
MHYFVTVYQHTADKPALQRQLLHGLSSLLRALKSRSTAITLLGYFNAAWGGHRDGYTGDYTAVDNEFT